MELFGFTHYVEHDYHQLFKDGNVICGVTPKRSERKEMETNVTIYFGATSADQIASKVKEFGGQVVKEPFDVYDKGRMASFVDPTGAPFCTWQSNTHKGIPLFDYDQVQHGYPCWFELMTKDADTAKNFYENVYGIENLTKPHADFFYTLLNKGDHSVGGIMPMGPEFGNIPPHWMAYFLVDDIHEACNKVESLGGSVCQKPHELPGIGWFAIIKDGADVTISLMSRIKLKKKQLITEYEKTKGELSSLSFKLEKYKKKLRQLRSFVNTIEDLEEESQKSDNNNNNNANKRKLSNLEDDKETKKRKKN
jgi:predicted enzyme related to lactoylglutathione lyase